MLLQISLWNLVGIWSITHFFSDPFFPNSSPGFPPSGAPTPLSALPFAGTWCKQSRAGLCRREKNKHGKQNTLQGPDEMRTHIYIYMLYICMKKKICNCTHVITVIYIYINAHLSYEFELSAPRPHSVHSILVSNSASKWPFSSVSFAWEECWLWITVLSWPGSGLNRRVWEWMHLWIYLTYNCAYYP